MYVDLHIHSCYSDGTMMPEEIVESALENNVGTIAIADHNVIEGSLSIIESCKRNGICFIPAVEIESGEVNNGINFHILAYGFDIANKEFIEFINHAKFMQDESGVKLIEAMQADYYCLSFDDYMEFTYDKHLGGWKAIHYLLEKGVTSSLKEGVKFYPQYNITYDKSGYSSIKAIAYRIRKAGGWSVLAHPGELIDSKDIIQFRSELTRIMSYGLDGIECYYPTHTNSVTKTCVGLCKSNNLFITAGSDCHGLFGKTRVGEMNITHDKVNLK